MTGDIAEPAINPFVRGKSGVSRADLLWGLKTLDPDQDEQIATILGFEKCPVIDQKSDQQAKKQSEKQQTQSQPDEDSADDLGSEGTHESPSAVATSSSYYRITSRAVDQTQNRDEIDALSLPDWFATASPTLLTETATRIPECHQVKPLYTELAAWSRLLPFLQKVLGDQVEGRRPDTARLVKQVANGEMIRRIPRKQRYNWSPKARILIDINDDNFPYRRDFIQLRNQLTQQRGDEGLEVQYVYDEPGGAIVRYDQQHEIIEPWRVPEPGTPILILSDLSMHSQSRQLLYGWLAFGQILEAQGWRATVLMPVAKRSIDYRLLEYFDCVVWDRVSRFKRVKGDYQPEKDSRNHACSIDQLLSYCFAGVRIDSGLLRALRHKLPGSFDIGHETAIWRHLAVIREGDEWGWQPGSKENYFTQAQQLAANLSADHQQRMIELIGRYHAQYPDELYFEAMYNLKMLGLTLPEEVDAATEKFMQDMVATYRDNLQHSLLHGWIRRHLKRHEAPALRHKHDYWLPFLAFARMQDARLKGETETKWPDGMTPSEIETVLNYINHVQEYQTFWLRQEAEKLVLLPANEQPQKPSQSDDWATHSQSGALVLALRLNDTRIFHIHDNGKGHQRIVSLDLTQAGKNAFQFPAGGQHTFQVGRERFMIDVMAAQQQKQDWMQFIGSGSEGLYAESMNRQNEVYRWYWHPPEWDAETGMLLGFWFYLPTSAKTSKLDWATDAGRDQYGIYADAEIVGVIQRFRWIEPNSFMMGSPQNEAGRYDNETQHQVILTQGYWVADTACTQELWQAVMGDNPSRFEGNNRPVEDVSWDDIGNFLEQINKLHPELKLRLPTEAEWENACRAGTETAFNFGNEITLNKVNYRGTWDDFGNWGEGALQQTAEVKRYPPNVWGLYEMHGNVWEWCQDWFEDYPSVSVIDPQGPDSGGRRVLRGGSWFDNGRYCRSASRGHNAPSDRDYNTGFRLARGHELKPVRVLGRVQ
ncbi:formylglycine-generating enzyme family protein [Nitrosomonas sp.]|uniref:formylglycine-generating enzyme family protein n=1 Tax=Nitrosomonas sp. TaxID=42353 RepID=UPI0028497198|nr:formylglycine-generating enzyme family protein [Nitrosomonas sp.]MDR4513220.1 formylglycine-generating enzyme family protein [Nitrosomonas sp.]